MSAYMHNIYNAHKISVKLAEYDQKMIRLRLYTGLCKILLRATTVPAGNAESAY